ncbi:dolichyl-diphosphooligosaccharide--protein glycosyltransferase subunit 1-like [Ruditapes philippinarum]|uniref:dolichyl-diphosphooligosaccharide--protein glycosyltransferase subunit 1-like n=1 Tax=Ruditapes philippinarum TaxID=129788 RepID=UPI00295BDA3A|nr:dolichyl-diphosphooligosaccharide--protein glycosyltransferase subunit 1-like [Ruditapes philippinarum]
MMKIKRFVFIFIALSVVCNSAIARQDAINNDLTVSEADRKIDTATHLVKIVTTVTIENGGKSSTGYFLVPVDNSLKNYLSYFGASIKGDGDEKPTPLTVAQTTVSGQSDKQFWRVNFPKALETGKSITLNVNSVYAHALTPFPRQVTQAEKQYVVFTGNLYVFLPYKVKTQTTTVTTASSTIESYTKTKPVSQSESTITYGPYENKEAFSEAELRVHSENNTPFLTITSMERVIEVSHWGNIAVEEHIEIRHSGAELKGPFSRYDYQRQAEGASVKSFKTILPAAARDVYYRDEIGNISTSAMREMEDMVEVELRPRFPLFGGWKTKYTIGYNVPSYQYLFNSGDNYALKMRFVDHIYDDVVIDQITFKIILPEGASKTELKTPFSVQKGDNGLHYTYLDTVGRPVIVAYKNNLVEEHIQDFELHYNFQKLRLLQEPLLVVGAFYLLFCLVIIYVRMDFSITKDEAKESKMRVASLVEEVQSAQDKRSALYQSYDDAIDKFKAGKDHSNFMSQRKKIDGDYKQLTSQIQNLQGQLKSEGSDLGEKVAELNRLDHQYKEQISLQITYAEKLVANKFSKQQYLDNEKSITEKRGELYKKMDELSSSLQ